MRSRALTLVTLTALLAATVFTLGASSAVWTAASQTPVVAAAANDWTPPLVSVTPLPSSVASGDTLAVSATASDERSAIASTVVEFAPTGTGTWTALSCTGGSGASPATASCTWSTTGRPLGGYDFRARATDAAGYSATSAIVTTQITTALGVVLHTLPTAVRGSVTVTATLLNPTGNPTLRLEYLVGGIWTQLNGNCTSGSSPLSCSWNTLAVADGSTQVRAWAQKGNDVFTDVRTVVVDNSPPTATLSAPSGVLSGSVTMTATATDAASGVASVAFAYRLLTDVTWTACGTDTFAPYTCALNTTALADGAYFLRAIATDVAGNESLPSTLTRSVDNSPASVSITAPSEGATVSATTTVTVAATSGRGVASVRVEAKALPSGDFLEVCTDTLPPYSCSWNVSALSGGYALRAVLTETSGGASVTSALVNVTVNNAVGSLTITSPAAGATVSGNVTVAATATPAPGRLVTSVRFESGPAGGPFTQICPDDLLAPYSCSWSSSSTVYSADHRVRAVMTQSDLTTVTSTTAVVVDNVTGSVDLVSPAPSARLTGTVPVTVSMTSNAAATGVQVLATSPGVSDVVLACTPTGGTPPAAVSYSCAWDTSAVTRATYTLQARATLANGTQVTDGAVTGLDVRNLRGVDVQAIPDNNKAGQLSTGDKIVLTWSDVVDLATVPTSGTATILNDPAGDLVQLPGNLGTVRYGPNLASAGMTAPFTVLTATVMRAGVQVTQATVTFGGIAGNEPVVYNVTPTQLVWTPTAGVRAPAPYAADDCSIDPVTESGALDVDL